MDEVTLVEATHAHEQILQQMLAMHVPARDPQHEPAIDSGALINAPISAAVGCAALDGGEGRGGPARLFCSLFALVWKEG